MTFIKAEEVKKETVLTVAKQMMLAARTAPKARGIDNLSIAIIDGDTIVEVANKMRQIGEKSGMKIYERDANNILQSDYVFIIGTKISPIGLVKCGMCGFANCSEKQIQNSKTPCVFNTGDLGIAMGSAVSIAIDNRVDNRVMYTIGQAVIELGILGEEVKVIYGIPLSATSKNPFFDRKPV